MGYPVTNGELIPFFGSQQLLTNHMRANLIVVDGEYVLYTP